MRVIINININDSLYKIKSYNMTIETEAQRLGNRVENTWIDWSRSQARLLLLRREM